MMAADQGSEQTPRSVSQRVVSVLTLFTSTSTLLCCALPAALATFAGGTAVIALTSTVPWLIPLSRHKDWIFLTATLMLLVNGILILRPKGAVACRLTGGHGCEVAGRFTKLMFWSSTAMVGVGAFFSYAVVPLLRWLEG